jgi:hypothetical protein
MHDWTINKTAAKATSERSRSPIPVSTDEAVHLPCIEDAAIDIAGREWAVGCARTKVNR